jgi:hypothetical protein
MCGEERISEIDCFFFGQLNIVKCVRSMLALKLSTKMLQVSDFRANPKAMGGEIKGWKIAFCTRSAKFSHHPSAGATVQFPHSFSFFNYIRLQLSFAIAHWMGKTHKFSMLHESFLYLRCA